MLVKNKKIKTVAFAIFVCIVGNFGILSLLPRLVSRIALLFGTSLQSSDLLTKYSIGIGVRVFGCLLLLFIMKKMRILEQFHDKVTWKTVAITWMFYLYIIFNFEYSGLNGNTWIIVMAMIIDALLVGLYEEFVFRGFVLNIFIKRWGKSHKGVVTSAYLSSIIFGLVHLFNLFSGAGVVEVCVQVVYATIMGIAFSALLIRTNWNLLWCALIHGLFDVAAGFGDFAATSGISGDKAVVPLQNYIITLLLFVPSLVYAIFLLRKVGELPSGNK